MEEYIRWLLSLYETEVGPVSDPDVLVKAFGSSAGVSTAYPARMTSLPS
jgi:hypothetical protein